MLKGLSALSPAWLLVPPALASLAIETPWLALIFVFRLGSVVVLAGWIGTPYGLVAKPVRAQPAMRVAALASGTVWLPGRSRRDDAAPGKRKPRFPRGRTPCIHGGTRLKSDIRTVRRRPPPPRPGRSVPHLSGAPTRFPRRRNRERHPWTPALLPPAPASPDCAR